MEAKRGSWSSRATFIFAAIGSAVGLGNAWRFPGLAARHGGGTFLLVYLVAMIVIGWPLLMMEIGIGRKMQQGAPGAFKGINKKSEFIGWAAVINAFYITAYYAVILGWILVMIVKSFSIGTDTEAAGNLFFEGVLQYLPITSGSASLDIPWAVLLGLLVGWGIIYLCIRKGTKSVSKVAPYLVIIPVVLLAILGINGLVKDIGHATNPAAGLKAFFVPHFEKMGNAQLWIDAFGQVFYSLSIMMAIMIAYGSFVNKKADIVKDSLIIAVSDMLISCLSGVVLFTTLNATGQLESYLESLKNGVSSIGTAFVVYPQAMTLLTSNGAVNAMFSVIFYMTLLTLAIDSAYSIVEGIATAVSDKFNMEHRKATQLVCLSAFVVSLLFASKAGLEWLDIVDNWVNTFTLITVGIIECIVVGWGFKTKKLRDELNRTAGKFKLNAAFDWIIKVVAPLMLFVLLVWNIVGIIKSGGYGGYPMWAQIVGGWALFALAYIGGIALQIFSRKNKKMIELDSRHPDWDNSHSEEIEELLEMGIVVEDKKEESITE